MTTSSLRSPEPGSSQADAPVLRHERAGERLRSPGLCADLLRLVLTNHTLLTGEVVIAELSDVLDRKLRLSLDRINANEAFLREQPVASRPGQILGLGLVDADDE